MELDHFFSQLWQQYCRITPQAEAIHRLFESLDGPVQNDHIAFRTLDQGPFQISALEPHLLAFGYRRLAPYQFAEKHLDAWSYQHPDPGQPLIFFSQLELASLGSENQKLLLRLLDEGVSDLPDGPEAFFSGPLWARPSWSEYQALEAESDYAAWFSIWGLCANHFTIHLNSLHRFNAIKACTELLKQRGYRLNDAGGLIKGSPDTLLEQASTLADRQRVRFADGSEHAVPSCYYEFARRYPDASGTLFQGFVPASADKIFHSTHRQR